MFLDADDEGGMDAYDPRVTAAVNSLSEECRRIGLYDLEVHPQKLEDGRIIVIATAALGDVAFRDHVQDPEQAGFNTQARTMELDEKKHEHAEKREDLKRRLKEGKPLIGDDPDRDLGT